MAKKAINWAWLEGIPYSTKRESLVNSMWEVITNTVTRAMLQYYGPLVGVTTYLWLVLDPWWCVWVQNSLPHLRLSLQSRISARSRKCSCHQQTLYYGLTVWRSLWIRMRVIKATSMNIGSKLNQARTRPTMSPAGPGRGGERVWSS